MGPAPLLWVWPPESTVLTGFSVPCKGFSLLHPSCEAQALWGPLWSLFLPPFFSWFLSPDLLVPFPEPSTTHKHAPPHPPAGGLSFPWAQRTGVQTPGPVLQTSAVGGQSLTSKRPAPLRPSSPAGGKDSSQVTPLPLQSLPGSPAFHLCALKSFPSSGLAHCPTRIPTQTLPVNPQSS